jgi:hypothetical protein
MKRVFLFLLLFISHLSFGQFDLSLTTGSNEDQTSTYSGEVRYSIKLNGLDNLYFTPSFVFQYQNNTDYQNFLRLGLTKEYGILNVTTGIETSDTELELDDFSRISKRDNWRLRPFIRFDAPLLSYNENKKDLRLVLDVDRQAFSVGFGIQL